MLYSRKMHTESQYPYMQIYYTAFPCNYYSLLSRGISLGVDDSLLELSRGDTSVIQLVDIGVRPILRLGDEEVSEDDEADGQSGKEPASPRSPVGT